MKKIPCLLITFVFPFFSFAGNVSGSDIGINCVSGNTRQFTITIWGDHFSANDTLHINFGDNSSSYFLNQSAFSFTSLAPNFPNDSEIKWVFNHTYPATGTYSITASYTNRDTGISNIPNSSTTIMVSEASFTIDPVVGCNSSPYFANNHLIEWLTVSTNFNSTFGAFDPNSDSLAYSLAPCMDTSGIIAGYTSPDVIGGGSLSINAVTGDISWNSPNVLGKYNLVVYIQEWKLMPNGQRSLIETVMRELQLDVGTGAGINEQHPLSFSFFPDPVSENGELHFQFEKSGNYSIKLINAEGKTVFENVAFCEKNQLVNLPSFSAGIYFLSVSDEDHPATGRKILVQNR